MKLTEGAKTALNRLAAGDKLVRRVRRFKVSWRDGGDTLHHLTFKNLMLLVAIRHIKTCNGNDIFGITRTGRALRKET